MNKKLLLTLALATLIVPRAFCMEDWVDPEDVKNDGLKEREALKKGEEERAWNRERDLQFARLRAQQVKKVAEQTFSAGPIITFAAEALSPDPEWLGNADGIFIEAIEYMVTKFGLRLSNVKKINLHGNTRITNTALFFIAQRFPAITSLDLSSCTAYGLTTEGLQVIAKRCPGLTYINVTNGGFARRCLGELHKEFPKLHIIDNTPEESGECF